MVIVRREQFDSLSVIPQKIFVTKVTSYLRQHLGDRVAGLSDDELREKILAAQSKAETHGVVTERGIAKWAYLFLLLGPEFDQTQEIAEYLRRDLPAPTTKVDNLMRALAIRLVWKERGV